MNKKLLSLALSATMLLSVGCSTAKAGQGEVKPAEKVSVEKNVTNEVNVKSIENKHYIKYPDTNDIKRDTKKIGKVAGKYYSKYMTYSAPNGKPIYVLAQEQVTDEQLLYAYSLLSFYLKDTANKEKSEIANKMADNNAMLIMPGGADRDGKTPDEAMSLGQNLNYAEVANVGSKWYTENDYEHRDASFEEIFHMVHDYGIGTTQNPQADNEMTQMIYKGLMNALPKEKSKWGKEGKWALGFGGQITEWEQEGSLEQEYIVSTIDSYYGLWNAFPEKGGMWGGYIAKSREDVEKMDPLGHDVMKAFLTPYITTQMRVDPSFEGDFKMSFDKESKYTFKSQYLLNVALTGSQNSNLYGNNQDNILMGNRGNNIIDGNSGSDIVQFRGESSEYTIEEKDGAVVVTDMVKDRDGVNTLKNIEVLRFTDQDK